MKERVKKEAELTVFYIISPHAVAPINVLFVCQPGGAISLSVLTIEQMRN